jgi:hypothetical protein
MNDVRSNNQRQIRAGTGYPEGERFTLQLIEISYAFDRSIAEQIYHVGCDAAFSTGTQIAKPSGVLLHYNYGAAAVKWWGHHTDILRSQNPPHPAPAPQRRRQLRPRPRPAPAAGPSAGLPRGPPKTRSKTRHDKNISIEKRRGKQRSANERANESKAWESWDEDDWMLFCRLNTKPVHERLRAAREESSSNIRAWAQDVSDYQTTEH